MARMHDGEVDVDERIVRALLSEQMPHLANLPLTSVEPWGTDHAIYRLGDDYVVRLPRIHWATGQIEFENTWLPRLAPWLPIAVPVPVGVGHPGAGYPYRWAIHRWLPGSGAAPDLLADPVRFALDLADAIRHLRSAPTDGAPAARGRARPVHAYDTDTRHAIEACRDLIDADAALAVWEQALAVEQHRGDTVWVHGDLDGNCIIESGRLSGIVDWGSACAGDPAVDVKIVWSSLFTAASRAAFIDALEVDDATIARSKGAAVQQACAALPYYLHTCPLIVERSRRQLVELGVSVRP
jgi:aminoglycoside phosphotransferase (APT) family kinase protein